MGCAASRVDDSEVLLRCKKRRRELKKALKYRQDFSVAHIAYIHALRSIGSAFRRFAGADSGHWHHSPPLSPNPSFSSASPSPPPPPPLPVAAETPPPPSLPPASPSPLHNSIISRSFSMPPIHLENTSPSPNQSPNATSPLYSPATKEETTPFVHSPTPPPPSPPQNQAWDYFDFFHVTPVPFHMQEQRTLEQVDQVEEDLEEQGIPDLENDEQEIDAMAVNVPEEVEEREMQTEEATGYAPEEMHVEGHEEMRVEYAPEEAMEKSFEVREAERVMEKAAQNIVESNDHEEAMEKSFEVGEAERVMEKAPQNIEESNDNEELVPNEAKRFVPEAVIVPEDQKSNDNKKEYLGIMISSSGKNLIDVAKHIDDQFLKAYVSGKDVATLLEATKVSHASFSEFRDSIKVFNAITSYWSKKTPLTFRDSDEDSDMAECGMAGSHVSTLERLFAWEKKLYDEVKAGELIKIAFDRKCCQLRSQNAKGEDPIVIDKTRARIRKLDTRLKVALHAVYSVSLRIQMMTNEELYPQLLEILSGLTNMWKVMLECHKIQMETILDLKSLENSAAGEEISEAHRNATIELYTEMDKWQRCFSQWIYSQTSYIKCLLFWLRYCQLEADKKGRVTSSHQQECFPVFSLVENWYMALEHLMDHQEMVDAVHNFTIALHSLQLEQLEELRQKRRAEGLAKDLHQKTLLLQNTEKKYVERPVKSYDMEVYAGNAGMRPIVKNSLEDRRESLNKLRNKVSEEKIKHDICVKNRREDTLTDLKKNLSAIFDAITGFAADAVKEFQRL